jgi:hypothetical protein
VAEAEASSPITEEAPVQPAEEPAAPSAKAAEEEPDASS